MSNRKRKRFIYLQRYNKRTGRLYHSSFNVIFQESNEGSVRDFFNQWIGNIKSDLHISAPEPTARRPYPGDKSVMQMLHELGGDRAMEIINPTPDGAIARFRRAVSQGHHGAYAQPVPPLYNGEPPINPSKE